MTSAAASAAPASGPSTISSPMCERSNRPAAARTARCSSMIPAYWIGISQPAKSTILAPSASWRSRSGVGCGAAADLGHASGASWLGPAPGNGPPAAAVPARATSARSVSKVRSAGRVVEADPADLVELVVVARQVAAGRRHQEVVDGLVDPRPALDERVADRVERPDDPDLQAGLLGDLAQGRLLGRLAAGSGCPWERPGHPVALALARVRRRAGGRRRRTG